MPANPYLEVKAKVASLVFRACSRCGYAVSEPDALAKLEDTKEEFGDFASSVAFDLSKQAKKPPRQVAEEIVAQLGVDELIAKAEVAGAGYINFHLKTGKYAEHVAAAIEAEKGKYGSGEKKNEKVLVEFPSVNPNKPWHIGHMRNAILGDSVARILEFYGYKVEREDYIDDLGLQVAQSIWGYLNMDSNPQGKMDHWLGEKYVDVAKRIEEQKVADEVRWIMKSMERGDTDTARLGRELAEKCVRAQYETAFRLNIFHDVLIWESDIVRGKLLEAALEKAKESGAIITETEGKNAGCLVAKLEELEEFKGMESADKVLVRSDGSATYTGKDLAFQMWKFGIIEQRLKYKQIMKQPNGQELYTTSSDGSEMVFGRADRVINVIGSEQAYPQKVLKAILGLMGRAKEASNSIHLSYEHAALPEGAFSGRKGTWIGFTADEVIEETTKEALKQIRERFKDMDEKEKEAIANAVAIGAIRFDFLRTTPEKKIIFKWEEALRFEGDTAPYIQYSHARAARILEKTLSLPQPAMRIIQAVGGLPKAIEYGRLLPKVTSYDAVSTPHEKRLVKRLAMFPHTVGEAAKAYRPHLIADYLLDLSDAFSKFYQNCPVLQAEDPNAKVARIRLVACYKEVVQNGLWLLGIAAPERM